MSCARVLTEHVGLVEEVVEDVDLVEEHDQHHRSGQFAALQVLLIGQQQCHHSPATQRTALEEPLEIRYRHIEEARIWLVTVEEVDKEVAVGQALLI